MIYVCIMFIQSVSMLLQIVSALASLSDGSIRFLFYNNKNSNFIEIENKNLQNINVNSLKPLKILCHGLAGSSSTDWYKPVAEAYVMMDYNIIAIDWAHYAVKGYLKAISVTQEIGSLVGELIINATKIFELQLEDVHIIGHSLGSHIAGFSGKYIFNQENRKLGRITGLDPAGPLYNYVSQEKRLNAEDALFVDIIHTNTGVLGIVTSIGDMDFYPDGGVYQNRCDVSESECSHNMVLTYFIDSIQDDIFEAVLCDSYVNFTSGYCKDNPKSFMGNGCELTVKGNYFLEIDLGL